MRTRLTCSILTLLILGCAAPLPSKRIDSWVVDFRPYTEKGFFFSTEMYQGSYEPIGIITVRGLSGLKEQTVEWS
jgi:hypothetical protein